MEIFLVGCYRPACSSLLLPEGGDVLEGTPSFPYPLARRPGFLFLFFFSGFADSLSLAACSCTGAGRQNAASKSAVAWHAVYMFTFSWILPRCPVFAAVQRHRMPWGDGSEPRPAFEVRVRVPSPRLHATPTWPSRWCSATVSRRFLVFTVQDSCARVLLFRGGDKELKNFNSQTPFQVRRLLEPRTARPGVAEEGATVGFCAPVCVSVCRRRACSVGDVVCVWRPRP